MRISSSLPKFNKQLRYNKYNRLILLTSSLGLLLLLVITFTLPFNSGLFSKLFTKPFSHAASLAANISIDASNPKKDSLGNIITYPAAPPLFQSYLPDATSNSYQFAPTTFRYDIGMYYMFDQSSASAGLAAYSTAHPGDAPCGDPKSDCGDGGNNGGVPEYNWQIVDQAIAQLTNPNLAPTAAIFILDSVPVFLESIPGMDSYPNNLTQYSNITSDIWHRVYEKNPSLVNRVYFEVYNEPDRLYPISQYEALYAAEGQSMHQTATRFSSTAIIGGPAVSSALSSYLQPWLSNPQDNPYIDFVSWHFYPAGNGISGLNGNAANDWVDTAAQSPALIDNTINSVKSEVSQYDTALQKNGGTHSNNIPLLIDEYNVSPSVGSYVGGELDNIPQYETPFISLYTTEAMNDGLAGLDFYSNGGFTDVVIPGTGTWLVDDSFEIAPWAWTEYLFDYSVGLHYQSSTVLTSTSSDTTQSTVAVKFNDGTFGAVVTNTDENASRDYTVTISNTTLSPNTTYTVHQYLVDATHHDTSLPDITGTTNSTGAISFPASVPPLSVNGFSIGITNPTLAHVPNYTFHPFFDDFSSYGAAGATVGPQWLVEPWWDNQTQFEQSNWITAGWNNWSSEAGKTTTIATPASDGISFADSAAGSSTNAVKVSGTDQTFLRTGSYRADWTIPPGQKVDIMFQTDWASGTGGKNGFTGGQVWLSSNTPNPMGNVAGTEYLISLQELNGTFQLISGHNGQYTTLAQTTVPSNLIPQSKVLSSWRILIDASTVEVDRYDKASNTWVTFLGPVAHQLPQDITGMESGLIWLGLTTNDSAAQYQAYYANFSVTSFGSSTTPSPSPSITPTPTPSLTPTPTPSPTVTPTPKPTASPSACPAKTGDFNNDGSVNLTDLSIFAASYGTSSPNIPNPCTDINSDGAVNLTDLSLFAAVYGT